MQHRSQGTSLRREKSLDPGECQSPDVQVLYDGSATVTALGASTFHIDVCMTPSGQRWPAAGTFTLSNGDGSLSGDLTGYFEGTNLTPEGFPLHLEGTVIGAAGGLAGATGSLVFDGFTEALAATAHGTVSGEVDIPSTPTTKKECNRGGWRSVVNGRGRPFRNQGRCVAYVNHLRPTWTARADH